MEEHLALATGGSFCKETSTWLGQKKHLSLTTKELSGAITSTSKKCMRKSTKTFAVLVLPASTLNHCGETKMVMSKSQKRMHLV
jgi:hypothetical protein